MKYFLHDTSSFNDEKITELYVAYGFEGLGLFYTILEKIAQQEKPIKTTVLKAQLNVGKRLDRCWSFMEEIGLISSSNGDTFNEQLLLYSKKYQVKKEENAKRIKEWREKQDIIKNVTDSESISNTSKVNKSKVKESKVKEITIPIESEFLDYCKIILKQQYPSFEFSVKAKYEQWVENGWKDGHGNMIKNWKSKIKNTIPFLRKSNFNNSKVETLININENLKNEIINENNQPNGE